MENNGLAQYKGSLQLLNIKSDLIQDMYSCSHIHTHTEGDREYEKERSISLWMYYKIIYQHFSKNYQAWQSYSTKSALYIHFVLESKIVRLYFPLDKLSHA